MQPFELFGVQHIVALIIVAGVSVLSYFLGRGRFSGPLSYIGFVTLALYAMKLWSFKLQDGTQWDLDLPLALCDLTYLLCLACFLNPKPLLVTLVTYWGLGGTLQALIQPDVLTAFPSSEFIYFFIGHSSIIFAVFFLLGRAPHPRLGGWPGLKDSFLSLLVYTLVVGLIDFISTWNYGYLREKPQGASILDYFGPWPVYVGGGLVLALIIFSILALALKHLPQRREQHE